MSTLIVQCCDCKTIIGHTPEEFFGDGLMVELKYFQSRNIMYNNEAKTDDNGSYYKVCCAFCKTKLGRLYGEDDLVVEKSRVLSYKIGGETKKDTTKFVNKDEMKEFLDAAMKRELSKVKFTLLMINDRVATLERERSQPCREVLGNTINREVQGQPAPIKKAKHNGWEPFSNLPENSKFENAV